MAARVMPESAAKRTPGSRGLAALGSSAAVFTLALGGALRAGAETPAAASTYEAVELAEGVVAIVRPPAYESAADGNALIIINDADVVVVDAGLMPSSARAILTEVRRRTTNPVRYVISTHWHDDHVLGNVVFRDAFPGVEFIGHPRTLRGVRESVAPALETNQVTYPKALADTEARLATGRNTDGSTMSDAQRAGAERFVKVLRGIVPELPEIEIVPPTLLVADSLTLVRGEREIRVLWLGHGNTAGDLVVHLPRERVLATGDLVVAPVPFAFGSYIGDWIRTLEALGGLEADVLLPGHGPLQRDREYVAAVAGMLRSLQAQTRAAVERGLDLEGTRQALDLETFRARFGAGHPMHEIWFRQFFFTPATERAFMEASGEDLDGPFRRP